MNEQFNKLIILGLIVILVCSSIAGNLGILSGEAKNTASSNNSRAVVGPKNLLDNSDFSQISDWEMYDAIEGAEHPIVARYNNGTTPSYMQFIRSGQISGSPFDLDSTLNQTFYKPIWTNKYPAAVTCNLNYNVTLYIGMLDGSNVIDLEFWLEMRNTSTPGTLGQWSIASGTTGSQPKFITGDSLTGGVRLGVQQDITLNIGDKDDNNGPFTIRPPGEYELIIHVQLSCQTSGSSIICGFEVRFDNITLNINDVHEPLVVANNNIFGPYNADPGAVIDVDFFGGSLENTSLTEGKYRWNTTPMGNWNSIFTNQNSYTNDWSLTPIWGDLDQGENIIDIYCNDQVGNYNDSVNITIIKDTEPPLTNTSELEEYYVVKGFDIPYTAIDQTPSGGYNDTVQLLFEYNDQDGYVQYKPSWQPDGWFNESPIHFNVTELDASYKEGKYDFYTIGVDNATNYEAAPTQAQGPDTTTIVDYTLPESNAWDLDSTLDMREFDVKFNYSDTGSEMDHVELWYLLNNRWQKWNGTNDDGGNFTESPIEFVAETDGEFGFKTVGYDKAGNMEEGGTPRPNNKPPTKPDVTTKVDTQAPSPIFLLPIKKHIKGTETITVISDYDTERLEIFYWIDLDEDGSPDPEDIGSSWKLIANLTPDQKVGNNWTVNWDTTYSDLFLEFKTEEHLVVLKARGTDEMKKVGEGYKNNIEVDNIPPKVSIINPKENTPENEATMIISYEIDHPDGNFSKFYWSYYDKNTWKQIEGAGLTNGFYSHPLGKKMGNYSWVIPQTLRGESATIKIKIEVTDDTENVGSAEVGPIYINRLGPKILGNFEQNITLDEDFGEYIESLTDYETHANPSYSGTSLNWYVTGNSGTIFYITGGNNTDDSFEYTSILDKHGTETLTFHLWDPLFLEDTIVQTVTIRSINDPPKFENLPSDLHVAYDSDTTIDFSIYATDVDNDMSELTISADDIEHVTVNGLNLTFNYPASMDGEEKFVKLSLSDRSDITEDTIRVIISANHPPKWNGVIETLELEENEEAPEYLDLDDYFSDPDGDILTYTYISNKNKVDIEISGDNKVTFKAKPNVGGIEKVWFRAWDPSNAFADGIVLITLLNIPDPPIIKPIPDMNIRYDEVNGYGYDFSYFIYDPDNDRSELTIYVATVSPGAEEIWVENDPNNNMRLIFKFPFEAAEKTHSYALYAADPTNKQAYRIFNVTVVIINWPVEQIKSIPDQSFREDEAKENAFKLDVNTEGSYFRDIDGGTNFEILEHEFIKAVIDGENYVDLSSKVPNWNTGDGFAELVVVAKDTYPDQNVYVLVRVFVRPVNDKPVLKPLGQVNVTEGEPFPYNLDKFITDVDTDLPNLEIVTGSNEKVVIDVTGSLLIIESDNVGTHEIQIWIKDVDNSISNIEILKIKVKAKDVDTADDNALLVGSVVGLVIVIIIILAVLMIMFTTYKVKEVFLIHKSGILLSHLSREHKPGRDEEILSGMFTAVQEFIKDSFSTSTRPGEADDHILREMKIGDNNNILIERGNYIYLAVIFSGRGAGKLRNKVRNVLNIIEKQYEQSFKRWVGDMDKIAGVEKLLHPLLPSGGTQVITSEKQLGRVPAPHPSPAVPMPTPRPSIPTGVPAKAIATPTPAKPIAPVSAQPAKATPRPAMAVTPAAPAAPATAVRAATALKCPKCGAVPNRFPDGSMLCSKCGYTGN